MLEKDRKGVMTQEHLIAINYLSASDPRLKSVLKTLPNFEPVARVVNFENTARIVIGQQLSLKAANTIYGRVCDLAPNFTPAVLAKLPSEDLRQCGLSNAKARYVQALAEKCLSNPSYLTDLSKLDDGAVDAEIQSNPGFGPWSAQIFLLFHLRRPNIFPHGDATLNRAIKILYGIDPEDRSALDKTISIWSPHRSVACLALWKWIDEGMPELEP